MADLSDEVELLAAAGEFTRLHLEFERARACILRGAQERVDRLVLRLVPADGEDAGLDPGARASKALPLAARRVRQALPRLDAESG